MRTLAVPPVRFTRVLHRADEISRRPRRKFSPLDKRDIRTQRTRLIELIKFRGYTCLAFN
jgi:hypothetical protein